MPRGDRLLVRPAGLRVLGAPAAGGTVARFALDAIFQIDFAGDERRRERSWCGSRGRLFPDTPSL